MKLKIAICDCDEDICISLYKKLNNLYKSSFEVDCFTCGEELCDEMEKNNYDLIFLAVELPNMNGIEVGRYIRENLDNETIQIVYMSSDDKCAMELFEMHPLNFLIKPITEEKIEKIIEKVYRINRKNEYLFGFKVGHKYYQVSISDILYFYSNGRKIKMITINNEYEFYDSLKDIYSRLKSKNFLYVHKSFLVNSLHIREYQYEQISMSDNKVIPISQSHRKQMRARLID